MTRPTLLLFSLLLCISFVNGQDNSFRVGEIDGIVAKIDSIEKKAVNIGKFIVAKYSDSDSTRLYNHYILDTTKRDFYKCIYDCTFRGFEEITFYFIDRELIKVKVKVNEYNEDFFNATYYFDKGSNIYKQEDLTKDSTLLWSIDRIKAQAKKYLNDIDGIITFLDNRKR